MKLKAIFKELIEVAKEFWLALGWCVVGVLSITLILVGISTLAQWETKEILRYYTPFMLGLFSIGITLYLFDKNVRETRERSQKERHQAVRPVLVMSDVASRKNRNFQMFECYIDKGEASGVIEASIENAGIGTALNVIMYMQLDSGLCYRVYPDIHKLAAHEEMLLVLHYSSDEVISAFITVCQDVYGNSHIFKHETDLRGSRGFRLICSNKYIGDCSEDGLLVDIDLSGPARSRDYFWKVRG
ncbi:hypothetical protein [Marinobacter sp. W-8]|uniref:hypothetical protein n=1 Tax=Marinobacter sp. W-8 TaxID=3369658 RepID=UPI0037CC5763